MGNLMSMYMTENDIRQLAMEVVLPKILLLQKQQQQPESSPSDHIDLDAGLDTDAGDTPTNSEPRLVPPSDVRNESEKESNLKNLQEIRNNAATLAPQKPKTRKLKSKNKTNPKQLSLPPPILCQKQLPPFKDLNNNNNDNQLRSSSPPKTGEKDELAGRPTGKEGGAELEKNSTKILIKSKTKKLVKSLSSREILEQVLGKGVITENKDPVEITATFKLRPDYNATFKYSYNPTTKTEVFKTNCGRDKLTKLEIPLDKNGNADATQFIKSLAKLSSKHEGKIILNGYTISLERDPSRRLKIISMDIRSNPMVIQLSPKGIIGVTAGRTQTKLEITAETEFGGDINKRIKFEGQNASSIKLYSPEGMGKLYVCLPTENSTIIPENQASPIIPATTSGGA